MMKQNHADPYEYYRIGWELPLIKLCDWQVAYRNPMGWRILSAIELLETEQNISNRVLDLGCGVGATSILIAERNQKNSFCCIDLSLPQIEAGKMYVENLGISERFSFVAGDVTQEFIRKEALFDIVIATEIIEHLEDPRPLLLNARRLGKKNALYIFSVPLGKESSPIRYRIVKADGSSIVTDKLTEAHPDATVHQFYHKSYLRKEFIDLLEAEGYSVLKSAGANAFGYSVTGDRIKRFSRNSYILDKYLNRITFSRLANTLNILCKQK
jgi:2-polyprenyl-3-methyl-5-hydroxy-6-metoxy-1,4-benzoquinol methylase